MLGTLFGASGKTSIRGGSSMAYDYIFDNPYILSNPPPAQRTRDCPQDCPNQPFSAQGGISPTATGGLTDPATARAVTTAFITDQEVPYSLTWTGSFQRQFMTNRALELRYLGTRGIHLLTQNRLNSQAPVAPEEGRHGLPTFFTAPTQAQIDATAFDLADIQARPVIVPALTPDFLEV